MGSVDSGLPSRLHDPVAHEARSQHEASIKRNPHPDFKLVEGLRPDWDEEAAWRYSKTCDPSWDIGKGGNDGGASLTKEHIEIDPYAAGRPPIYNYKLMISGIIPRPIGLLSTISIDGTLTNLAPFSYTNMVCHDPPVFTVGFTGGIAHAKDTLGNLVDTGECVLNIISEHFVEAANSTSTDAPYGVSEWGIAGLHSEGCTHVKPARVKESIFAVECKLLRVQEFDSRSTPGKTSGTLAVLEGINFWVREDAINEERNIIDPAVLRPVSRLGGITYGRLTEGFEIPRPAFSALGASKELEGSAGSQR